MAPSHSRLPPAFEVDGAPFLPPPAERRGGPSRSEAKDRGGGQPARYEHDTRLNESARPGSPHPGSRLRRNSALPSASRGEGERAFLGLQLVASAATLLALAACGPRYPPIADVGGDAAFKAYIAQRYGPGTPAVRLRDELAREGFVLVEDPVRRAYSAILRPANLPCYSETRIDWLEDRRGRIALIQAARHACT